MADTSEYILEQSSAAEFATDSVVDLTLVMGKLT